MYSDLQPPGLWRHFAALNGIPRGSGREAGAREYVRRVAESAGAEFSRDEYGNAIVRVGARVGAVSRVPVAVQAHLDMICVAADGVTHDFERDPIVPERDGDAVSARGTTLGADNGIGVAAALALLTEPDLTCGPLELLFTVEEEVGLLGALHFDTAQLQAGSLVNLDSENDEALTVGCAGGVEVALGLRLERTGLERDWDCLELRVSGLRGGHSGVQIHEHRASAIKLLAAALQHLVDDGLDLRLASVAGGSAHNAIPTEGAALFAVPSGARAQAELAFGAAVAELKGEWGGDEPGLQIELRPVEPSHPDFADLARTAGILDLLRELPHGVLAMSSSFPGTVATSANLAMARTEEGELEILVSIRALSAADLDATASRVERLGEGASASIEKVGGYPGWEPREGSPLAAAAAESYESIHGKAARIEVVHGGLECGVLVASKPDLDAISFGPLIREAHTPREHVYASTVTDTWHLLLALLEGKSGARP